MTPSITDFELAAAIAKKDWERAAQQVDDAIATERKRHDEWCAIVRQLANARKKST